MDGKPVEEMNEKNGIRSFKWTSKVERFANSRLLSDFIFKALEGHLDRKIVTSSEESTNILRCILGFSVMEGRR